MKYVRVCARRRLVLPVFLAAIYIILFLTGWQTSLYKSSRCDAYPKNSDIAIIVKTGGTETFQKIPTLLLTFLKCAGDDVLIFSDMEMDIGEQHIYDSLDKVINQTKFRRGFDLYRTQKQYKLEGGMVSTLDRGRDAWKMDRFKNIHTAQKAHHLRPGKSWYFFIDADTYIIWPSFFAWLKRLNPNKKLYLGSVVKEGIPLFAHGGSGYLLSRAAMAELVGGDAEELAVHYERSAIRHCCGDQELAKTLFQKGINVSNVWPMINGEQANSMPLGPSQWCQPLITMHHMSPEEINDMWQYEGQREHPSDIILGEDLFLTIIEPMIMSSRDDWDNKSVDTIYTKSEDDDGDDDGLGGFEMSNRLYDSYDRCSEGCKEDDGCLQFSFTEGKCGFGASVKLGERRESQDGVSMRSGWHLDKIAKFKAKNSPCKGPDWVTSHEGQ